MDQDQLVMVKREVLLQIFDSLQRADLYHSHAHKMQVAEGIRNHNNGTPLYETIKFSLEALDGILNPPLHDDDIIEG